MKKIFVPAVLLLGVFLTSTVGFGVALGYGGSGGSIINSQSRSGSSSGSVSRTVTTVVEEAPAQQAQVAVRPAGVVLGEETFVFTRDLTIGSNGADVVELQKRLRTAGFFTHPTDTGYFGVITQNAVIAYQKAHNISPAMGYVGPITRSHLNSATTTTASAQTGTGDISLKEIIELLISMGVIAEDKIELARTYAK